MEDLKFKPFVHQHAKFLAKARKQPGFTEAYDSLREKYWGIQKALLDPNGPRDLPNPKRGSLKLRG
jgi:hypothetical protein